MTYKVAKGWVNPATAENVVPQPRSDAINEGVIKVDGDGNNVIDGHASVEWEFTVLTPEQLDDLLTQFDLIDNSSYKVTISTPQNDDRTFVNFYGRIQRPRFPNDGKHEYALWKGVVFKINRLRAV